MEFSRNVLVIESLSVEPENHGILMLFKSELNASLKYICPNTGHTYQSIKIIAVSDGISRQEALKNAIEIFMNGNLIYTKFEIHRVDRECIDNEKIDRVDILLPEPYKSLFEQLFDVSNWQIPKLIAG